MLSKRLQIIITLMFVTMMFLQTPAIASTSAVLINNASNANTTDYQSGNQFSSGNTQSTNTNLGKSNLNGISQSSTSSSNVVGYNQSGTVVEMNSSYVHPKQSMTFTVNSSQINNFVYNNSFSYQVRNQYGQTIYPLSANIPLTNGTTTNSTPQSFSYNWNGQSLNGQIGYSSNSSSQLYAVNVSNVASANINSTIEQITWNSYGNTTSIVSYKINGTSTWTNTTINAFTNIHSVSLAQLLPNTTYLYQVSGHDDSFGNGNGRYVNGSILNFKTDLGTSGAPYINSTIDFTSNNAITSTSFTIISFNTTTPSSTTIYLSTSTGNVYSNPHQFTENSITHNIAIQSLTSGTPYFFAIVETNGAGSIRYDNNGQYYSFVTLPVTNIFQISSYSHTFNQTSSQATISFDTNTNVSASIFYSLTPNFLTSSVKTTPSDSLNTTHTFTINMFGATTYYIRIKLTNSTYTYIFTNKYDINNNYYDPYSFTTGKTTNQDNESSLFTIILEMPTYPAVLGNYQFQFYLSQKQKLSPYTLTANTTLATSAFIVNDTLVFNPTKTLIQRGTFTNITGTYPIWVQSNTATYSPTDVVSFIGTLSYSSSSMPINNSNWVNNYVPTGLVNLYTRNQKILTGSNSLYNIYTSPLNVSSSFYSGLDANTNMIMNVTIPAVDIYGSVSIELNYNIPNQPSYTFPLPNGGLTGAYDNAQNLSLSLNVKYRLMETTTTGQHKYQLTQTDFVGSATIIPMRYENNTVTYPQSTILNAISGFTYDSFTNVTNYINLPGQKIHLNLSVTLNGVSKPIFELTRINYTWFWSRATLDSSLQQGNYTVKLLWTGLDGSSRGIVAIGDSVYTSSPIEFSTWYELGVSFTIKDMTANITVLPNQKVTLRFKAVVPATGIAWDQDLGISLASNGTKCNFDPVTGEYHVSVTAPSLSKSETQKVVTLQVTSSTHFTNNTLTYIVTANQVISSNTSHVITQSNVNKHISLIGYGYIVIALVATVIYAASIAFLVRRK